MTTCSKKSRRAAIGANALPTPPEPMTRIRMAPVSWLASGGAAPARVTGRRSPPLDGPGVAVVERGARRGAQIPVPAGDVRAAVDDGNGDRCAVRRVPERHHRSAGQRLVGD